MYLDMGFLVRNEMRGLGFGDGHVVGYLGIPNYVAEMANSRIAENVRKHSIVTVLVNTPN